MDKRAEIADSVAEAYGHLDNFAETTVRDSFFSTLSLTQNNNAAAPFEVRMESLERSLSLLLQKFSLLEVNQVSQERNRSRSRYRNRSRSRSRSRQQKFENCWYHWKFGINTKKCDKPCKMSSASGNDRGSR